MAQMARRARQKVVAVAGVALLLAGGAIAAVSATGQDNGRRAGARAAVARAHARDLATAASYLGVSTDQLTQELRSGKTLAELADATAGRSKAGMIGALVAAWQRAPGARSARISAERLARREKRVQKRATRLVERSFAAPRHP